MAQETWKDIENYEGLYQVSNLGRVKSLKRYINCDAKITSGHGANRTGYWRQDTILKEVNRSGYKYVMLCRDKHHKSYAIHRLVAQAFIPNPNNLPQVNHKDEDKSNNVVDNLEWCTDLYNKQYGTRIDRQRQSLIKNEKLRRSNNPKARKVICNGIIYNCIADCAEANNIVARSLYSYLGGSKPMPKKWKELGLSYYREEAR